jgi:hypothetical protein
MYGTVKSLYPGGIYNFFRYIALVLFHILSIFNRVCEKLVPPLRNTQVLIRTPIQHSSYIKSSVVDQDSDLH